MSEQKGTVAIVGSGFMGLATAFWLCKQGILSTIYYDPSYQGASEIATGLLHLFHGQEARMPPFAQQALAKAFEIMHELDHLSFLKPIQLLRPARHAKQVSIFKKRARIYPDKLEWGAFETGGVSYSNCLLVKHAWIVDSFKYLKALKDHLVLKGCTLCPLKIEAIDQLQMHSKIIFCLGANTLKLFPELPSLLQEYVITRGQLVQLEKPQGAVNLESALNARVYVTPHPNDPQALIVGATFEREPLLPLASSFSYRQKLIKEAYELWPSCSNYQAENWKWGFRLSGPAHLPFIATHGARILLLSGLGSKGLLYHSWLAYHGIKRFMVKKPLQHKWEIMTLSSLG